MNVFVKYYPSFFTVESDYLKFSKLLIEICHFDEGEIILDAHVM